MRGEMRDDEAAFLRLLRAHATDVVAFQGLAAPMRLWFLRSEDGAPWAAVAFFDTGHAWVASGGPVAHPSVRSEAARA